MSLEIAKYQFHPWARKGISANITEGDDLGNGSSSNLTSRATVNIAVELNGTGLSKNFALISPGDIIGINRDMIVRTEPLNWITDYEPNYLAFLEFYDEDFAWRYTPAASVGERLRPWIFLLVLKEDEFERSKRRIPLPSITVKNNEAFPPFNETWLWAHVHSNADIPDSELSTLEKFLLSLKKTRKDDPNQFFSRLMSPRKLEANTAYYAFLVPAFETGRLAGLEDPTADTHKAQEPSWDNNGAKGEMPVYFEWFFRTGVNADFESLVKLLEPRAMDPRVGIRDMDCSSPGFVKADDVTQKIPATSPTIIGLEGALKSPSTQSTVFPDPPSSKDFQIELQKIVNLPATMAADLTKDPIISVPLYGSNHAKKSADDLVILDVNSDRWVNDLNRDPRTRVPAGFGTLVIQNNQENFMHKAWDQVMKIIEANRIIKATFFNMKVAVKYTQKTFSQLPGNVLLAISKPVLSRVMGSPTTILHQINESILPSAVFSGAFRRLMRPKGKLARKISVKNNFDYNELIHQINNGEVTSAPPKQTPAALPNTQQFANKIFPHHFPAWIMWLIENNKIVLIIMLILLVLLALITGAFILFAVIAAAAAVAYPQVNKLKNDSEASANLSDPQKQLDSISSIPPRPNFTLRLSDETTTIPPTLTSSGTDSFEAKNFRTALIDFSKRLAIKIPEKVFLPLNITNAQRKVSTALHPNTSFVLQLSAAVKFPNYIPIGIPEKIFPAMAYPDFEDPMYKKLSDISNELLLPNLKLIPPNTISLLKTNQKFIESYMVGLNHEMGRELLWREYPTDERGSYFRQFWDVNGIIRPSEGKTEAETTEEYKDIKPIHTWLLSSLLGRHNNRDAEGDAEQTVLVIRGDLLKRYPNTVIFAQKAVSGAGTPNNPQIEQELSEADFEKKIKFPLYKADISPDIKFFGFDLTIEEARGTDITNGFPNDHLGWFFILQEVPGEPRFGMDVSFDQGTDGLSWDDVAWNNFPETSKFIKASEHPTIHPPEDLFWGADSAKMAYILFQKPSMVAVHAKEMLENLNS
jgi:hypothetical protein